MRLKTEIWVSAYLRRLQGAGVSAVIVRRGDAQAGAIYICVNRLDGFVQLYVPAPAAYDGHDNERRWVSYFGEAFAEEREASRYLAREMEMDPDLWIIDVEDKRGRHFLGEAAVDL